MPVHPILVHHGLFETVICVGNGSLGTGAMAQEASRTWNAGGPVTEQQFKMQEDRSRGGQIGGELPDDHSLVHQLSFFTSCLPAGFQLAHSLNVTSLVVIRSNITHPQQQLTTAFSQSTPGWLVPTFSDRCNDRCNCARGLEGVQHAGRGVDGGAVGHGLEDGERTRIRRRVA